MADLRSDMEELGPLTLSEVSTLQQRLAPDLPDFRAGHPGAVTLADVAEATGMPESDVAAQVRQIRAESGFRTPVASHPSALPWIAGGSLVLALGITWWRMHPEEVNLPPLLPSLGSPSSSNAVHPVTYAQLNSSFINDPGLLPTNGIDLAVSGQTSQSLMMSHGADAVPLPYDVVRERLITAIRTSTNAVIQADQGRTGTPNAECMTSAGDRFRLRPGYIRVSVSGWPGVMGEWVAVPLVDEGNSRLDQLADQYLANVKAEQDTALQPVKDVQVGVVTPPPGYMIHFAGRRHDVQFGPRISFSGIEPSQVSDRIEAALMNAIYRDGRRPTGEWTGGASVDEKIPRPKLSEVEITGPDGTVSEQIPTGSGGDGATKDAVHKLAQRVAGQVQIVNRRGIEAVAKLGH